MNEASEAIKVIVNELSAKNAEIAKLQQRVYDLENTAAKSSSNIKEIYMSIEDAATRYGVCKSAIYELIAMPESPNTVKYGQRRLLPIAAFDDFFEKRFSNRFTDGKTVSPKYNYK